MPMNFQNASHLRNKKGLELKKGLGHLLYKQWKNNWVIR